MSDLKSELNKSWLLASLLPTRPLEFYDRVMNFLEGRLERAYVAPPVYRPDTWDVFLTKLETHLQVSLRELLREPALLAIESEVSARLKRSDLSTPFTMLHNGDWALARLCYLICRITRPLTVVETGVAYGVTSAFILQALEANGRGTLHSVDLPPLGTNADDAVGILIPAHLKPRWRLHRGESKRALPKLVQEVERVDLFVHDSLHTYRNMRREFRTIATHLARPSVVIADDVDMNNAFQEWADASQPAFSAVLREEEKRNFCGLCIFD
jgi:predicted O-methyltransferase YrrM